MEIRGQEITLRFPVHEDAEGLLRHAADSEVTRWFSWGPYTDLAQPLAWIAEQEGRRARGEQLDFVIRHRVHGPVGVTGLSELHRRDRRAVVGSWLGRELWGTGANAECKALLAHLAFAVCGLERLGAYSNPANARSARALQKAGWVHEGRLRRYHRHDEARHDVDVHGLLVDDWRAGPLAGTASTVIGAPPAAWMMDTA